MKLSERRRLQQEFTVNYDYVMGLVEDKIAELDNAYETSTLPASVDAQMAHDVILEIRS